MGQALPCYLASLLQVIEEFYPPAIPQTIYEDSAELIAPIIQARQLQR